MPMRRRAEAVGDRLIVAGGLVLLCSLFFTWSHQFSAGFLARWRSATTLAGVPRDPNAWQVYSIADVLLALLAVALAVVALIGGRRARIVALALAAVALAFVVSALDAPPTNGALIFDPSLRPPGYAPSGPVAGPGEAVAIGGLGAAMLGLLLTVASE
jgi:hypothetical protein